LNIAGEICVFTNTNLTIESLKESDVTGDNSGANP